MDEPMYDLSGLRTGRMRRVHAKHGDYLVLAGDSNGIGALLEYYGEFCEREIALMCALTRPGDTIVEVGANIGTHTIPLARHLTPAGRLVALEAQPVAAMLLEANLALNGIDWVEVHLAGGGREAGFACVPSIDYEHVANLGGVSLIGQASEGQIRIETVDSLALRPALIKIDVEGMELDVLDGAVATIESDRPVIYVENNPTPVEESVAVLRRLQGFGYDLYWDVQSLHETTNFRRRAEPFFAYGHSSNVLALPPGRDVDRQRFGLEPITDIHDHKQLRMSR
jgi:FkbM family methyltransferase